MSYALSQKGQISNPQSAHTTLATNFVSSTSCEHSRLCFDNRISDEIVERTKKVFCMGERKKGRTKEEEKVKPLLN